ncbi:MAG: ABC transporter permease [Vicinamibacterales bacterium]
MTRLRPSGAGPRGHGTGALTRLYDVTCAWTVRILRARYQQSILGWAWAVVQPMATVAIFSIVFTRVVHVDTGPIPYVVFSYTSLVPWSLLAGALPDMTGSMVANIGVVTKVDFPREALPIGAFVARLTDFAVSFAVLVLLVVAYGLPVTWTWLIFVPIALLVQSCLIVGLGLGCAALNVFYRDVDPMLRLVLQLWFYASPILYPIDLVPTEWRWFYLLNPMAGIIETYRAALLANQPPDPSLGVAALTSMIIGFVGYWLFKRVEGRFADVV